MVIYGANGLTGRNQARQLLAIAAQEVWGLSSLPELVRTPKGKPFFSGREDLQFNLSHSGNLALCALDDSPIGVDIQVVKEWRPALPRRVCSPSELAWLERQAQLWPAFTLLWSLKESRSKESGQGLTVSIREIRIPLPAGAPVLLDGLWFQTYPAPGWAAAVCGHNPPPAEIIWRTL